MAHENSFAALVPVYLDACRAEGKSPKTVVAYAESLRLFQTLARQLGLPQTVDAVTAPDVYRFLAAVRATGVCDATQHRRHREVKHFYSWLRRMEIVTDSPFHRVPLIKLEQKVVQPLSVPDIQRILALYDPETLLGARNRAITLFLLDTGVRASELIGLDVADVDLLLGRAHVRHGKGGKQRIVAFGPQVAFMVEHYLDLRGERSGPLFQTRQRGRMLRQGLIVLYQRASAATGIPKIHAHRFRHTFATMAIRSAAREIDVQHLLGHSTSAMVRRYTRTYDAEQAATAHATFSPVALLGPSAAEQPTAG